MPDLQAQMEIVERMKCWGNWAGNGPRLVSRFVSLASGLSMSLSMNLHNPAVPQGFLELNAGC